MDEETEAQTGSEAVSRRGQRTALSLSLPTVGKTQKFKSAGIQPELPVPVGIWRGEDIPSSDYNADHTRWMDVEERRSPAHHSVFSLL